MPKSESFPKYAGIGKRDGSKGPGRLATDNLYLRVEVPLREWLLDRAAILGIPYTVMLRDVLAAWRELVIAAELEEGLCLDLPEERDKYDKIIVPDRVPGYKRALVPRGNKPSHLDDSPLHPSELM